MSAGGDAEAAAPSPRDDASRGSGPALALMLEALGLSGRDGFLRGVDVVLVMVGIAVLGALLETRVWATVLSPIVGMVVLFRRRPARSDSAASELGQSAFLQPTRRAALIRVVGALVIAVLCVVQAWRQTQVATPPIAAFSHVSDQASTRPADPASTPPSIPSSTPLPTMASALAPTRPADPAPTLLAGPLTTPASTPPAHAITPASTPARPVVSPESLVRAGTVFGGLAYPAGHPGSQLVLLELVTVSPTPGPVVAALHNDGGWTETRTFTGEWAPDPAGTGCRITLRTGPAERVEEGGPVLDESDSHTLSFDVTAEGRIVPVTLPWQLQLQWLSEAEVARHREALERALSESLAATMPGREYVGSVVDTAGQTTEPVRLRFTAQDASRRRVEAVLESTTTRGLVRWFGGEIVPNKYRAGASPIRLTSPDIVRVAEVPQTSILGHKSPPRGLTLILRPNGGWLEGEAGPFRCEFEPVKRAR